MTSRVAVDVGRLPNYSISSQSLLWWGQMLLAVIEGCTFLMLIAIYFYLRLSVDVWPPPGTQLPHLTYPTLALIPLFASVYGSYYASEGAKKDDRKAMIIGMVINLVLALVFLLFRYLEVRTLNFYWTTDAHGSIFWSILFLHTLDVVGDLIFTMVLIVIIGLNRHGPAQRIGVHVDSIVWYFLVGIWIPLYAVLYWGPYFVGAPK